MSDTAGGHSGIKRKKTERESVHVKKIHHPTSSDGGFRAHRHGDSSGGDHYPPCWESNTQN